MYQLTEARKLPEKLTRFIMLRKQNKTKQKGNSKPNETF